MIGLEKCLQTLRLQTLSWSRFILSLTNLHRSSQNSFKHSFTNLHKSLSSVLSPIFTDLHRTVSRVLSQTFISLHRVIRPCQFEHLTMSSYHTPPIRITWYGSYTLVALYCRYGSRVHPEGRLYHVWQRQHRPPPRRIVSTHHHTPLIFLLNFE